ncbi:winged helix-turn-helix transcriptional regulator [Aliikangiella marina]|uniref:Winged helix-turn-helix transcriptional regulator n=1 Tax=Aliikangiella marina TaxID=1712262 RepID=A0A545TJ80_9GAMM|nr:metalloregulator ArsR/SmtB family transcription factor [Aliikangiella marina]TQV77294.1 winged helix-turn-helix transcriptional regulator [Aliikangiella marina]
MNQAAQSCRERDPQDLRQHADEATRQLKALANVNRLMILCILSEGELSVTELNATIDLSQSALSQHLAKLRADDLVETRRESQTIYYSIKPGVAKNIISVLHDFYCA